MRTVIVVPTHDRKEVTARSLEMPLKHGIEAVVVISDPKEADFFKGVHVVKAPNNPLGAKFQAGVDFARTLNPDNIIISGSDDFLSSNFFSEILPLSWQYDFIGLRSWFVYHEKTLYHFDYMAPGKLPLGGGRIFSKALLDSCDWKIFDTTANKLLDDKAWTIARNAKHLLIESPEILAIKGNWKVMNKFTDTHPNIRLVSKWGSTAKEIMKKQFGYEA